ncbi:MAG: hypothetical protein A2653_01040 [Candidatus Zambryskibacteria bacterium RIFCSPHIGHO2_01_FULL_43_25]|uniref:Uncharacterized protein n=1 Tax=Candidatus Zambryskibacteria bacterium RIFCSPLOWO2_01_FULL_45_21 TaxID=1802761 RepID=A0A1G2U4E6_9BACT|nr:MAG: hypothetical protein A2653_01040 [Candidatus Zambryskibacteria bacterium RIFCSPHIGHO2_01_FULL_43_25]OHB00902.1 MAG: hypothetical protein A3E94_01460 [Candidatus Zambryskibacteria bacterium RIFCSPHIGHO2_12_FULL_44_12b]OHB04376.1 MAG: hypothetical protein A3B14_01860 [Candidatus Zambryskibacteria bacterium RIFCSPLOWO2_01_FULL_45_21]
MKRLPYWLQAAIFALVFVPLIFFLKVLCPISAGCLADPFLIVIFSPLFLFSFFPVVENSAVAEPLFIVLFWTLIAIILGYLYGKIRGKKTSGETS